MVYLIRFNSENFSNSVIKFDNLYLLFFSLKEYALTFCPKRVISFAPFLINSSASIII